MYSHGLLLIMKYPVMGEVDARLAGDNRQVLRPLRVPRVYSSLSSECCPAASSRASSQRLGEAAGQPLGLVMPIYLS
jgi:hypothetical protein